MHTIYNFDFLDTISAQLFQSLESLNATALDAAALIELGEFQASNSANQGVYVLYHEGRPVYIGKAEDVRARLAQHLKKLSGRANISVNEIEYKALLLDKSISTAANETILMGLFMQYHTGMWNSSGFGPRDPGQHRDTTKISDFDRSYPIRMDFPLCGIDDRETIASLFKKMKRLLPFVFRYQKLPDSIKNREIDLRGVPLEAVALLRAAMKAFDSGWRAAVLHHGMVVYEEKKTYSNALAIIDAP